MVWHFIGIYIMNRTLHGRLEIRNSSSSSEIFFSTRDEKSRISWPCNILYLSNVISGPKNYSLTSLNSDKSCDGKCQEFHLELVASSRNIPN